MGTEFLGNKTAIEAIHVGGKARNLQFLSSIPGVNVPAWFCTTTTVCETFLCGLPPETSSALANLSSLSEHELAKVEIDVSRHIEQTEFDTAIASALLAEFDRTFAPDQKVAVRSSAVAEDASSTSFAGQLETYLNVGRADLLEKVKLCISSAYSSRALAYAQRHKLKATALRGAVIIQQLIHSVRSGVIFTCNPITGDRSEYVITAAYGLGEGVVQETAEADTYYAGKNGEIRDCKIEVKTHRVISNSHSGVGLDSVPHDLQRISVLNASDIRVLIQTAKAIDAKRSLPQDIEWGIDAEGILHVFQTRDITSKAIQEAHVLDSSNIAENYKGPMTPLSLSYVRKYYRDIFRSTAKHFGANDRLISQNAASFDNLVAQVNSSIYYNLANWYRIFKIIPGFTWFTTAFEYGVSLPPVPAIIAKLRKDALQSDAPLFASALTFLRVVFIYTRLPALTKTHQERFDRFRREVNQADFGSLALEELRRWLSRIENELAPNWHAPLVNDYYSFQFFWALERLSRRWGFSKYDLLASGNGNTAFVSMEPVDALKALARKAAESPIISQWITAKDYKALEEHRRGNQANPFWTAFATFLQQHGDRRYDELKFESPTYEESPTIVYDLICSHLNTDTTHRQGNQSAVGQKSKNRLPARGFLILWALSAATRRSMAYREYGRLVRSQRFSIERRLYLAIAQRMVANHQLACPMDICYLTVDEVSDYVCGWNSTTPYAAIVSERKKTFDLDLAKTHHERILVNVTSGAIEAPTPEIPQSSEGNHTDLLTGTGCSPGVVRGRAHVVLDPRTTILKPGEILIAQSTDPAWALLMSASTGLVVERGNILSHAAIVGRELGIPCVIGAPNAMLKLRSGDLIEIDGSNGTVRRLSS